MNAVEPHCISSCAIKNTKGDAVKFLYNMQMNSSLSGNKKKWI